MGALGGTSRSSFQSCLGLEPSERETDRVPFLQGHSGGSSGYTPFSLFNLVWVWNLQQERQTEFPWYSGTLVGVLGAIPPCFDFSPLFMTL